MPIPTNLSTQYFYSLLFGIHIRIITSIRQEASYKISQKFIPENMVMKPDVTSVL